MHIDTIDAFSAFEQLRDAWNSVYEADPESHIFLSHQYLDDWLKFSPSAWLVLAVKPTRDSKDYVAFLPLRIRSLFDEESGLRNELYHAGSGFVDYSGLLCLPEMEKEAIPALAAHIRRKLHWGEFRLESLLMCERRQRLFFRGFDKRKFDLQPITYIEPNGLNNGICPVADLPDTWDGYLARLSANNRQKIRRLLRKLDESDRFRITVLDGQEAIDGIDVMLDYWLAKWSPKKGDERAREIVERNRAMLRRSLSNGTLFVPAFHDGDRQVALLATMIDPLKRSMLFWMTGRDEEFTDLPAGYLLHAFSIRHAIENGFRTYDFLRGTEPYKYVFANRENRMSACVLRTHDKRNHSGTLDPRCLDSMVKMAIAFDDEGKGANARKAYLQIIETAPRHALILYRLGRLLARQNEHSDAAVWLRRSIEVERDGDNAWLWLARSLQALGRTQEALAAWNELLVLRPAHEEAGRSVVELHLTATREARPCEIPSPARVPAMLARATPAPEPQFLPLPV